MSTLSRRQILTFGGAALLAAPAKATSAGPDSLVRWSVAQEWFGGFSGIEVSADRGEMIAISDRGHAVRARLLRDARGRLIAVEATGRVALRGRNGAVLEGTPGDAEGLDWDGGGSLAVAFEGGPLSRVARYDLEGRQLGQLRRDPRWLALPANHTIEALAIGRDGRAIVIPEDPDPDGFAIYRESSRGWDILAHLPVDGPFKPVGADFGPDGALYLLERKFRLAFFGTRISRLVPGAWSDRRVLVETAYGVLDNHEGISVTSDAQGRLWATTISDDNRNAFQRTEIAEFLLER